ncbi:MAG: AMP-binding protein [Anaerolineales bacterium]|jgi:acyl-CoA synthetase (AMP-forming)/AMP-acid ligase II
MGLRDLTLYHILVHNARTAGPQPAVITPKQTLSHQAFLERVDQLAAGITSRGVAKGDRICILAQNAAEYLELYGACAKTGAIAYPINWRLSAEEIQHVFALAEPQMLVVGAAHAPQLEGLDTSGLKARAVLGEGSIKGFEPLAKLYAGPAGQPEDLHSDDPFAIISTAAIAGVPRGAVLTHGNMLMAGCQLIASLALTSDDRHLAALPLFHITGLGMSLATLQAGGANVVTEGFDPAAASKLIDDHNVTLLADFPPVLSMLLDARQESKGKWNSLRYVLGLDAPDVIQRLHTETKAKFWTGFGQSETTGVVTLMPVEERPGAAGRPLPVAQVRCINQDGAEMPVGETGEIAVRGPLVFAGYWRDPDATHYAFRNGWHHTGDLGKFDADGYLYYAGRKPEKELIKSGGENVYPAEVERVIQEMPEVSAVCVIGVPDEQWGEAVKAVVELVSGASLSPGDIADAVASRIASFKKPRYVDFVEDMPRDASGEIDRQAVKEAHG